MGRITTILAFLFVVGWAAIASATCPVTAGQSIEAYVYGCPAASGPPYASTVKIPVVPSSTIAPASSLTTVPASEFVAQVTDGTNTQSGNGELAFVGCFVVSGGSGVTNATFTAPDRTVTSLTGDAFVAGDMCGQVNLGSGATVFTVPAVGSGIWNTGATAILVNNSGVAITVTNTATVNGPCGGATFIFPVGGTCTYVSNGTTVDSAGMVGLAVLTAPVTLTATGSLDARTQCGLPLHYNSASAGTITISANAVAAGCNFPVVAVGAGLVTIASGGTLVGNTACLATPRTKGQYSTIWVEILSNAGSAPVVNVSGDCG